MVCSFLFETGDKTLGVLAVESILGEDSNENRQYMEGQLRNEKEALRLLALAYFGRLYTDQKQFEELLTRYIQSPPYYYNVVVWLDRLLYAPDPFRTAYKDQLDSQLKVTSFISGFSRLFG